MHHWGNDTLWFEIPVDQVHRDHPIHDVEFCERGLAGKTQFGRAHFWRSAWLDLMRPFTGGLRMLNWQAIREQEGIQTFEQRKRTSFRSYAHGRFHAKGDRKHTAGAPLEVCLDLARVLDVPIWLHFPHGYTDSAVQQCTEAICSTIDTSHNIGLELSNEIWNRIFGQNRWAETMGDQEEALSGRFEAPGGGWTHYHYAGFRSARVMQRASEVFLAHGMEDRLVRIMGLHTGSDAHVRTINARCEPVFGQGDPQFAWQFHDTAAVTGYWGGVLLRDPQWASHGAMDDSILRMGADKNTINARGDVRWVLDFWRREIERHGSAIERGTWARAWANTVGAGKFKELVAYEINHHVAAATRNIGRDPWAREIAGLRDTPEFVDLYLLALRQFHKQTHGGAMFHFVLAQDPNPEGDWRFYDTLEQARTFDGSSPLGDAMRRFTDVYSHTRL